MNVRFSPQLLCYSLSFCLTFANLIAATAGDFDCGSDIVPADESAATCPFELSGTEELCGWGDFGTHDSASHPTPAAPDTPSTCSLDASVTAIATAACASAGVSVEQIVEPFAMVGPYLDNSLEAVEKFQSWWNAAMTQATAMRAAEADSIYVEALDIQGLLDALAAQEPVDVENFGPSVLLDELSGNDVSDSEPGIQITAIDPLVGSSPIIVTIEEDYLPYDLSAKDIKLWSVFPVSTHPFCIRSRMEDGDASAMWREFDEVVSRETVSRETASIAVDEPSELTGSADCLMEELVWNVEEWIANDSPAWTVTEPRHVGRQLARLVSSSDRLVRGAAGLLALHWPQVDDESQASPAGEALLARAGAIEASQPIDAIGPVGPIGGAERIAELSLGSNLR